MKWGQVLHDDMEEGSLDFTKIVLSITVAPTPIRHADNRQTVFIGLMT